MVSWTATVIRPPGINAARSANARVVTCSVLTGPPCGWARADDAVIAPANVAIISLPPNRTKNLVIEPMKMPHRPKRGSGSLSRIPENYYIEPAPGPEHPG